MSRRVVADLLCDVGGAFFGFIQTGHTVTGTIDVSNETLETHKQSLYSADLDEYPDEVTFSSLLKGNLNTNRGGHIIFEYVRNEFGLEPGKVDVIAGCLPCQNSSKLRDTTPWPENEPRGELLQSYVELARIGKPGAISFENVQRVTNKHDGEAAYSQWFRGRVRGITRDGDLEEKEYGVSLKIVNAASYRAPQRRMRTIGVYIYGASDSEVEFPPETHARRPRDGLKERWVTVKDVLKEEYERGRLKQNFDLGQKQIGVDGYPDDPVHRSRRHNNNTVKVMKVIQRRGDNWKDPWGTENEEFIRECHRSFDIQASAVYGIMD